MNIKRGRTDVLTRKQMMAVSCAQTWRFVVVVVVVMMMMMIIIIIIMRNSHISIVIDPLVC